jgi:L-asparaginase / beta-aspartyl-peptidase
VRKTPNKPALLAHGGAGARAPMAERVGRRQGLVAAVERGSAILREGGHAIDAVTATVALLEDNSLFNAGYGSVLTLEGRVEMDAAIMVAERRPRKPTQNEKKKETSFAARAGGVALVRRLPNPILLARWVMDHTPHVLIGGVAAERLARRAGIRMCRPEHLITERARNRWLAILQQRSGKVSGHQGTVGAAALDRAGNLAAATSTGGVSGKMPGRIGDSAIIGAGLYAAETGAASATGAGETIMKACLCREAITYLTLISVQKAAVRAIDHLYATTGGEAGLVIVDSSGRFGYAHNAQAMEIALSAPPGEVRHLVLEPVEREPARH